MTPILTIKNIRISQVDFNDLSYLISPQPQIAVDQNLTESISKYGILHPPIVKENSPAFYSIVAGRKRLLALKSLQAEAACSCLIISRQLPEIDVFHILLEETRLTRHLTTAEKAVFLQKIAPITDEKKIVDEFLPRLGLPPDPFLMKQVLMLLDLEDPVLQDIHQGYIHERVALEFVPLSPPDRRALFALITSLHLSVSNQKKLLTICRELASRENTSIAALLDHDAVHEIVTHQDANPPQKTKKLMTWLTRRHMPRSRQAEDEFNHFTTTLRLPSNVSVGHTPFFENDAVTLAITFNDRKSLQHAWEKIRQTTNDNEN